MSSEINICRHRVMNVKYGNIRKHIRSGSWLGYIYENSFKMFWCQKSLDSAFSFLNEEYLCELVTTRFSTYCVLIQFIRKLPQGEEVILHAISQSLFIRTYVSRCNMGSFALSWRSAVHYNLFSAFNLIPKDRTWIPICQNLVPNWFLDCQVEYRVLSVNWKQGL